MQSSPYLSVSVQEIQEQERRAANLRSMRGFSSHREAEHNGYYSLKRLKQLGLSVPDWMRPYYAAAVETRHGNLPVFSRQQATESSAPGPVPREEVLASVGVEILLPEADLPAEAFGSPCGLKRPLPGPSSQAHRQKEEEH